MGGFPNEIGSHIQYLATPRQFDDAQEEGAIGKLLQSAPTLNPQNVVQFSMERQAYRSSYTCGVTRRVFTLYLRNITSQRTRRTGRILFSLRNLSRRQHEGCLLKGSPACAGAECQMVAKLKRPNSGVWCSLH